MDIMHDPRLIKRLIFDTYVAFHGIIRGQMIFNEEVGRDGVEKIVAYEEPGEMGLVVWFALYANGEIYRRVNGKMVFAVDYFTTPPKGD